MLLRELLYPYSKAKLLAIMLLTLLSSKSLFSQDAFSTAGGEAIGSGGSLSYTLGLVVYTTYSNNNFSLAQGVQHAYELPTDISLDIYPNPTIDFITINVPEALVGNLRYSLFDINGKFITTGGIITTNTQINMQHLAVGVYILRFLNIQRNQRQYVLKTVKIVKII